MFNGKCYAYFLLYKLKNFCIFLRYDDICLSLLSLQIHFLQWYFNKRIEKHVLLYNCKKIFNEYCKLQRMKNWSVYKNLLVRRRHSFFTSSLLNKKLPIISTRNHFNLETGQLNLSHNIEGYDFYDIPGLNGNPYSNNDELVVIFMVYGQDRLQLKNR
jgi:hypothetical protein